MREWNQQEQERLAQWVLAADPKSTGTLREMGERFQDEGQLDKAAFCLRSAADIAARQRLELDLQCSIWISLGRVLMELEQMDESEGWLRRAATVAEEQNLHALTRNFACDALASLLRKLGRDEEAQSFEQTRRSLIRRHRERWLSAERATAGPSPDADQVELAKAREPAAPSGEVIVCEGQDVRNHEGRKLALPIDTANEGFEGIVSAMEARAQVSQQLCGQAAASEHSSQEIRSANDLVIVSVRRTDAGLVLAVEVLPAALPSHLPLARFCVLDSYNHLMGQGYVGLHRLSDGRGVGELDLAVFDSGLIDRWSPACTLEVVPVWGETLTSRERNDIAKSLEAAGGLPGRIAAAGEAVLRAVLQRWSPPLA